MALSKDCGYYYNFRNEIGEYYQLWFVAGDVTDVTYTGGALEFDNTKAIPSEFINEVCKLRAGYPDPVPFGLLAAETLELSINISHIQDIGADDWTTWRDWILAAQSATTRTVNGREINIPNRWFLRKKATPAGGYIETWFDGLQDVTIKDELVMSKDAGVEEYEIKCTGMLYNMLNTLQPDDYASSLSTTAYTKRYIVDQHYQNKSWVATFFLTFQSYFDTDTYQGFHYTDIQELYDTIESGLNSVYQAYVRNTTNGFNFGSSKTPHSHINHYRQSYSKTAANGAAITAQSDIKVIADNYLISGSGDSYNKVGIYNKDCGTSFYKYAQTWDLFKYLLESNVVKSSIDYGHIAGDLTLNFTPCLDNTLGSTITATSADYKSDVTLYRAFELIDSAKMAITDTGIDDINEIEVSNNYTVIKDSQSMQGVLHNLPSSEYVGDHYRAPGTNRYIWHKNKVHTRTLYYLDATTGNWGNGMLYRVNDNCTLDLGNSITISDDLGGSPDEMPEVEYDVLYDMLNISVLTFKGSMAAWIDQRVQLTGLPYIACKAVKELIGNIKQYGYEGDMLTSKCKPTDVGCEFTIDPDNLLPSELTYMASVVGTKAYLVDYDADIVKGIVKTTHFIKAL